MTGFVEHFFGALDADPVYFLAWRAPNVLGESLVKAAHGHGSDSSEIIHGQGFVAMAPDMAQAAGDSRVGNHQRITAFAHDEFQRRDAHRFGSYGPAPHELIQDFRPPIPDKLQVGVDTGNGGGHGSDSEEGIIHANDADLVGNLEIEAFAGFKNLEGVVIGCCEQCEGL